MAIKHTFTSAVEDGADETLVRPVDWNADHEGTATPESHGNEAHDANFEEQGVAAGLVDGHKNLTTGVHGAGANHLALFGVASTVVTKFTPLSIATYLWRGQSTPSPYTCDSSFEALIAGNPSATSVVYDTDSRERSLPDTINQAQWGKVILHNITRGNSRKITGVNLDTDTITTESSTDDWADNDIITIGSQTCSLIATYTYSRFFDVDISPNVPATVKAILAEILNTEISGASTGLQNSFGCHPFEAYGVSKFPRQYAAAAYQVASMSIIVPVISQKICIAMGAIASVNASGIQASVSLIGYWE